ncbi:MAG TPA: hypothetical protein VMW73_13260 [Spirochaetia bacterium]|nr:hypothetical protein [Spirochaetia bacterium]
MRKGLALVLVAGFAVTAAMAQSNSASTGAAGGAASASLADNALYVVGNLGSTQLYYTYLMLGMIGDSFAKGVYDKPTAISLAEEVKNLTTLSQKSLGRLTGDGGLNSDDKTLISDMNSAFDALLGQAAGLSDYVNGKDDGTKFQTYRQTAWDQISKIIGIKGAKETP